MKTIFVILFNVSIVLFQILSLILAIISAEMLKSNIIFLSNFLDNWSTTPVKHIQLYDFECPVNYEPIMINKYAISCDFSLDRDFLDLKSTSSQVFKNEKNQTFCEQRYTEFSYFQIKQKSKCDSKIEKDCGLLDTLGNHFCIGQNQSCPLNGIAIKHHETNLSSKGHHTYGKLNYKSLLASNYEYLPVNKDYSLVVTNNHSDGSALMIVDIDIIQGKFIFKIR
jgi:hypothetical protein